MNFPPPSERQARVIWLAVTGIAMAALVFLCALLVWGLGQVIQILAPVLWPIAVAGILAYLLDPVVDFLNARGLRRAQAVVCVFLMALLILGGVFGSIVPQVVQETRLLVSRIPTYADRLSQRAERFVSHPPAWLERFFPKLAGTLAPPPLPGSTDSTNQPPDSITATPGSPPASPTISNSPPIAAQSPPPPSTASTQAHGFPDATSWITARLPTVGRWLTGQVARVASWFGILAGLVLIPVYTFYFLIEKHGIAGHWTEYLPMRDSRFKNELVFALNSINNYLIAFFRGQVLVAICDAIFYTAGFLLIGLPYAILIGAAAVVLTMVPFLGAITICVSALIIAAVQFGDWSHTFAVLAVFAIVQSLEGLVISPRIMGGRVGLHPLAIIIAVMVGTTLLGGLLGGVLAIPLTAALKVLLQRYVWTMPETPAAIEPPAVSPPTSAQK
jgi:predicted PurR-regulated permease PerM